MSLANWSLLTALAASGILSAWLFYKLKVLEARHAGVVAEMDSVKERRAILAAQVITLTGQVEKLLKEAVQQYESNAKSIETSVTPGTPGSVDRAIGSLREAFKADVHGAATNPVLPAATAKPKG